MRERQHLERITAVAEQKADVGHAAGGARAVAAARTPLLECRRQTARHRVHPSGDPFGRLVAGRAAAPRTPPGRTPMMWREGRPLESMRFGAGGIRGSQRSSLEEE